jgi:hypothetical protein
MPLLKRCSRPPLLRENVLIPLALLDWGELTEASSRNLAVGRWEVHRAIMAEVHPVVGPTADEQRVDRVVRRLGAAVVPEQCQCSRGAREPGEPVVQFRFDADVVSASLELVGEVLYCHGAGPGALGSASDDLGDDEP